MVITDILLKKQGVQAPHKRPQLRGPEVERQAPRTMALKASGTYFQESRKKTVGNSGTWPYSLQVPEHHTPVYWH